VWLIGPDSISPINTGIDVQRRWGHEKSEVESKCQKMSRKLEPYPAERAEQPCNFPPHARHKNLGSVKHLLADPYEVGLF
jgi:hypothetical protein